MKFMLNRLLYTYIFLTVKLSLSDLYSEYGFEARLTKIEQDFPGANIICAKIGAVPEVNCSQLNSSIQCLVSLLRLLMNTRCTFV